MIKKILLLVLFLVVAVISYVYFSDRNNQKNLEATSVNMIKTGLDFYYVNHNEYPRKISDMQAIIEEATAGGYKITQDSISRLKNFSYEISGDEQTYRFTYTNLDGKTITTERNYQSGFNKY